MPRGRKKKEVVVINETTEIPIQEEMPIANVAPKAVTIQGKTVNPSISGKVRLFNVDRQKIITGFIPIEIAKDIVKQHGHIIIHNEQG